MLSSKTGFAKPEDNISIEKCAEPRSLDLSELPQAQPKTIAVTEGISAVPIVADGSVYDPKKPYLFVSLGNHTVHPCNEGEIGFDATSNRLISFVSLHDRCGVIVSTNKHMDVLQGLGYPVVEWGTKVAFPMAKRDIRKSSTSEPYTGGLVVHTFSEPMALHNRLRILDNKVVGDDSFDGLNHLAGAYIPLALALQCATGGDTQVNLVTTNSGLQQKADARPQDHSVQFELGTNVTSLMFKDKTGGSFAADNVVTMCAGCENNTMPLTIGLNQIRPGFEGLMQRVSGSTGSYITKLVEKIGVTVGNGMFANHDKRLEGDIRQFMSQGNTVGDTGSESGSTTLQINMGDLPPDLQIKYCTASMVAMKQPFPIAAPTVIVQSTEPDVTATGNTEASVADMQAASLYGPNFSSCSYVLEPHFSLDERGISSAFGAVALTHALLLSQTSLADAEKVCIPFAKPDSMFLPCKNTACDCHGVGPDDNIAPLGPVAPGLSTKLGRMLCGVSQNMALAGTKQRMHTNKTVTRVPLELQMQPMQPKVNTTKGDVKCTAGISFDGKCRCKTCIDTCRFLHLGQMVASTTHAFQKADNYVSDQTICSISAQGVPQYSSTECMLPFMTLGKSIMMKSDPVKEIVVLRVGMNTDDCENSAFQTKAVMETLPRAAKQVHGALFHTISEHIIPASATGVIFPYSPLEVKGTSGDSITPTDCTSKIEQDQEAIRQLHLGSLSIQDQRRAFLCMETLGARIEASLGYFVTGAASQANDTKHPGTASNTSNNPSTCSENHTVHVSNIYTASQGDCTGHRVELPTSPEIGMTGSLSKRPVHALSHKVESKSFDGGIVHTASEKPQLSGHCTCHLSVQRDDGLTHSVIVEGTAPVAFSDGDTPWEVYHRGAMGAEPDAVTTPVGVAGKFSDTIKLDNCVDMTVRACATSQVNCIGSRLAVPGTTLRPYGHIAINPEGSCETFYNKNVSAGGVQFIQRNESNGIEPGAPVKEFLTQKVYKTMSLQKACEGEESMVKAMEGARVTGVQVVDYNSEEYKAYKQDAATYSKGMSPLRFSPESQEKHMLNPLGSLSSLKVSFPDSAKLEKKYGENTRTFSVTHLAIDDTTAGRAAVLESITHLTKQLNNDYVNVRFSAPVMLPSGEMITLYKFFGVPKDPLLV